MKYCIRCGTPAEPEPEEPKRPDLSDDVLDNREAALLSYLGPLAFIPYVNNKRSPYTQYHAVRGVNLFICEVLYYLVTLILKMLLKSVFVLLGILAGWVFRLGWIFFIVLSIIGMKNVWNGIRQDLPLIGWIRFIKK